MRCPLLLVLTILGGLVFGSPWDGERHLKEGDYRKAIQEFENAIAREPKDPKHHYNLGLAQLREGDHEGAAASFEKAARLSEPQLKARALNNKASAELARGDKAQALKDLEEALSYAPEAAEIIDNLEKVRSMKVPEKPQDKDRPNREDSKEKGDSSSQDPAPPSKGSEGQQEDQNQQMGADGTSKQPQSGDGKKDDSSSKKTGESNQLGEAGQKDKTVPETSNQQNGMHEGQEELDQDQTPPPKSQAEAGMGQNGDPSEVEAAAKDGRTGSKTMSPAHRDRQKAERIVRSVEDKVGQFYYSDQESPQSNGKDW